MLCAWLARAAIFVFLIYFTVLDAIGGIGLGRTILVVQGLVADGKAQRPAIRRHRAVAQPPCGPIH